MMYDIESIEVLVHDVRMQLVDVFRWVCPRGGGGLEKWVPYRAQCSFVVKTGGFLLQMDVQGFNCFLLEWLVSTCLTVAACQSTLYCLVSALVHDSFLLPLWLGVYCLHQAFLRVPFDFKVILMPRRLHFFSILSLTPLT